MDKEDIPRRWLRGAAVLPKTYDLTPSPSDILERAAIENAIFRLKPTDVPFGPKQLHISEPRTYDLLKILEQDPEWSPYQSFD